MTPTEAERLLRRCTYKSGYNHDRVEIALMNAASDMPWAPTVLRVTAWVTDSYDPGPRKNQLAFMYSLRVPLEMYTPVAFLREVENAFVGFESHEAQEGFRVDGIMWNNPHSYPDNQEDVPGIRENGREVEEFKRHILSEYASNVNLREDPFSPEMRERINPS